MCLSPETGRHARPWGRAVRRSVLPQAGTQHSSVRTRGRHVNKVMNGTAALACLGDVKRVVFKACDSAASDTVILRSRVIFPEEKSACLQRALGLLCTSGRRPPRICPLHPRGIKGSGRCAALRAPLLSLSRTFSGPSTPSRVSVHHSFPWLTVHVWPSLAPKRGRAPRAVPDSGNHGEKGGDLKRHVTS